MFYTIIFFNRLKDSLCQIEKPNKKKNFLAKWRQTLLNKKCVCWIGRPRCGLYGGFDDTFKKVPANTMEKTFGEKQLFTFVLKLIRDFAAKMHYWSFLGVCLSYENKFSHFDEKLGQFTMQWEIVTLHCGLN